LRVVSKEKQREHRGRELRGHFKAQVEEWVSCITKQAGVANLKCRLFHTR